MIVAIGGGGDWADASIDYVSVTPEDNFDPKKALADYTRWYEDWSLDRMSDGAAPYRSFAQWLLSTGRAHEVSSDDLLVIESEF